MTKRLVLIPLDGSDFSRQIIGEVVKFINPEQNDLLLLRVEQQPAGLTGGPTRPASADVPVPMFETTQDAEYHAHPVYASQERDSLMANATDEMQRDVARLQAVGYTVRTDVRFGHPAEEILAAVASEPIDLVAMTTHGRSGLNRLVMGSVAEHVLQHVSIPLMLLHAAADSDVEQR